MTPTSYNRAKWGLCFLSALGCASSPRAPVETPAQTAKPRPQASARSLEQLVASVDAFEARTGVPSQEELAKVLQSLASAVDPVSHATNLRVREVAQRLAGSPATSLSHAGLLKQALLLVQQSLMTIPNAARQVEYVNALRALRESTQAIDDLLDLSSQHPRAAAAVRAATDVVFLARGAEAPFGEAESIDQPAAPLGSFETELERARDEVSALAQSNLTGSRQAAAAALQALGDVVAAADEGKRLAKQIAEISFEAERLKRAQASEFGQAGWIRSGLESTLSGLAALDASNPSSPWLRIAQRAVATIDPRSSLSFQRATVQDAFRTTVDAYAALVGCRGAQDTRK